MLLGLDLDNTIICYDGIFHARALELEAIPPELPTDKNSVSNYLKKVGRNDLWTEMQGEIYGPELHRAKPFPGVHELISAAAGHGAEVVIVSHKTRTAAANPDIDLHLSARNWLESNGLWGSADAQVNNAFFCETRAEKVNQITSLGCQVFVDDLPEVFEEAGFPNATTKILFDPLSRQVDWDGGYRAVSWKHIQERLFPS